MATTRSAALCRLHGRRADVATRQCTDRRAASRAFTVAIETNGTVPVLSSIDWICVSPKADTQLIVTQGNELKVVIPQDNQRLAEYEALDFAHFFVQPM